MYVEVMVPGVNCMYWPGPPEQTKGKEKSFHLPENNDKELYKAEQIMNGQEPFLNQVCRRLFVTYLVQARNLLTHFLLLESIAHASSRRQQQRTCTLVVALTFRSWPQVSFFTGARPQKMLMLESTRLNLLKGSHSFFV